MTVPPSVRAIVSVAVSLGHWRERVVFIGGAVAPLLQTDLPFPRVRPTDDVDAVAATTSYADSAALEQALRDLRFTHGGLAAGAEPVHHAHRWYAPDGTPFDLVPQGDHLGASGNAWDAVAVRTAVRLAIEGVTIRHVSAPGFLVLKWAAYADRGHDDPMRSTDLEDIVALLAARPTILDEIDGTAEDVRTYLRSSAAALIAHPDYADSLDAHLNNAVHRIDVIRAVRRRLRLSRRGRGEWRRSRGGAKCRCRAGARRSCRATLRVRRRPRRLSWGALSPGAGWPWRSSRAGFP